MAEEYKKEEIPTSHGVEEVETQDRGLFGLGRKDEVSASEFEQKVQVTEEEKKPSKLKRSESSSSNSSSEEEEEVGSDGEIIRKKNRGLQEKLIKKVGNKVDNSSVPEEQPPPMLDTEHLPVPVAEPTHTEEKKGLLEKIMDSIPGFSKTEEGKVKKTRSSSFG